MKGFKSLAPDVDMTDAPDNINILLTSVCKGTKPGQAFTTNKTKILKP